MLQDLEEKSLGVNQVEMEAWHREVSRVEKKGNMKKIPDRGKYRNEVQRNEGYIKKQMRI